MRQNPWSRDHSASAAENEMLIFLDALLSLEVDRGATDELRRLNSQLKAMEQHPVEGCPLRIRRKIF